MGTAPVPPSRLAEARPRLVHGAVCKIGCGCHGVSDTPAPEMGFELRTLETPCDLSPVTAPLATPTGRDSESRSPIRLPPDHHDDNRDSIPVVPVSTASVTMQPHTVTLIDMR